jgi:uncharacterized protein (TIGR03067 family)
MAHNLTGTWHAVYGELDGEMAAAAHVSGIELSYHANKFSVTVHGKLEHEGTYSVDDSIQPHQVTFVYTKSSYFDLNKPRTGIFQLTGETYKDCLGAVGDRAPSGFSTGPKSNTVLTIFRKKGLEGGTPLNVLQTNQVGKAHLW